MFFPRFSINIKVREVKWKQRVIVNFFQLYKFLLIPNICINSILQYMFIYFYVKSLIQPY